MIVSLRGRLLSRDLAGAVVECQGVGYGLAMSIPSLARLGAPGNEVQVLVHTHVAEDALRLYGFLDPGERAAFEVLLGTSGVGPRLALAILSAIAPADLAIAVQDGDRLRFTRIPGVGPKKADRLILELKGRLKLADVVCDQPGTPAALRADLTSALLNLGFQAPVAERAARAALTAHPQAADLTLLLRAALQAT